MRLYKILDALTNKIEKMYPIGSVYISVQATNPAESLGFGTWRKIEGRFLVATGTTGANDAGSFGEIGATPHTYGQGEKGGYTDTVLPEHTHIQNMHNHETSPHAHSIGGHTHNIPAHNHGPGSGKYFLCHAGTYAGDKHSGLSGSGYISPTLIEGSGGFYSSSGTAQNTLARVTDANDAQTTDTATAVVNGAVATNQAAGTSPINKNIPPFYGVNVWYRES